MGRDIIAKVSIKQPMTDIGHSIPINSKDAYVIFNKLVDQELTFGFYNSSTRINIEIHCTGRDDFMKAVKILEECGYAVYIV